MKLKAPKEHFELNQNRERSNSPSVFSRNHSPEKKMVDFAKVYT
jgi:hypothetical protein